ncbi:MAG TPA: zf-HC2 domain-containing protein [Acidimicrobiales bacterium]|nr:zf-HC2 domain-containing protein [Acidimicrobiales bacterium]
MTCAELEALAAELALGTVSGAERAVALDHLAGCPACRELVSDLAEVADRMLLLAPVTEPPPGFESKVLAGMGVAPVRELGRPARRRRVLAGVAAVALVAAMSAAGAAWLAGEGERPVEIRTALAADNEGRWRCRAVVYGDKPTWLVVSLDRMDGSNNSYSVEAVHAGSEVPIKVGTFTLQQGHGTLARPLDLPAGHLESVRVLDAGGRVRYQMTFDDQ